MVIEDKEMETLISSTFPQKVKSQGRIVIPKITRDALRITDGDDILITVRKIQKPPVET